MTTAVNHPKLGVILGELDGAKETNGRWIACCPSHEDRRPSLTISIGDDGRILLHCHAGCPVEQIVADLGLAMKDLAPPDGIDKWHNNNETAMPVAAASNKSEKTASKPRAKIVATYDYFDEADRLLSQAVRYEPKDFRQRRPVEGGGWDWSVKDVRRIPYRLPELLAAAPEDLVIVAEGEKDVNRLATMGIVATCNAGGAGKWCPEFAEFFHGRAVAVVADNDAAGHQHAEKVAESLFGVALTVKVIHLPVPAKGDASDWLDRGGTKEELLGLITAAPVWTPDSKRSRVFEPWDEPLPLGEPDLPSFPVELLPDPLRSWAQAEATATQTPVDLAAMLGLSVCAAAIAKKVEVHVRDGWNEPVNLFVICVLEPAIRKSAVFADATAPLQEFEQAEGERLAPAIRESQAEIRAIERRLKILEERAAKEDDPTSRKEVLSEVQATARELAEMSRLVAPKLLIDDCTSEKLASLLAEQGGRLASMSAEGGVFELMQGPYSKSGSPQFDVYLTRTSRNHTG